MGTFLMTQHDNELVESEYLDEFELAGETWVVHKKIDWRDLGDNEDHFVWHVSHKETGFRATHKGYQTKAGALRDAKKCISTSVDNGSFQERLATARGVRARIEYEAKYK